MLRSTEEIIIDHKPSVSKRIESQLFSALKEFIQIYYIVIASIEFFMNKRGAQSTAYCNIPPITSFKSIIQSTSTPIMMIGIELN